MSKNLTQLYQEVVRRVFANAILKTDGFMYWIVCNKEIISSRSVTPEKAWRSAWVFTNAR